jgi:hypothetical protein
MALCKAKSAAVYGIDAHLIEVEVDMYSSGSARDSRMVGMPAGCLDEPVPVQTSTEHGLPSGRHPYGIGTTTVPLP